MSTNDDKSRITNAVAAVGTVLAVVLSVLPAALSAKVGKVKEAVVAAAGAAVSVVAALQGLPFVEGTASQIIAYVGIAATAIATHWTAQTSKS